MPLEQPCRLQKQVHFYSEFVQAGRARVAVPLCDLEQILIALDTSFSM